jgi:hypothetical protein
MIAAIHDGNRRRAAGDAAAYADPAHQARMARLFATWERAGDWDNRAFRDHFLSPLHKPYFSDKLRQAVHALAGARGRTDIETAAAAIGWRIGEYGPAAWSADMPMLQARARVCSIPPVRSLCHPPPKPSGPRLGKPSPIQKCARP